MEADFGMKVRERTLGSSLEQLEALISETNNVVDRLAGITTPIRHQHDSPEVTPSMDERAIARAVDTSSPFIQVVAGLCLRVEAQNATLQRIINEMEL